MLIVNTSVLSGKSSVRAALKKVTASKDNFLVAEVGGNPSLFKQSQLRRIAKSSDDSELIGNLKGEGEPIVLVPQKSLTRFGIGITRGQLSGDVQGLMSDLNQRLAFINVSGDNSFLVSASEYNLVDYHCEENLHPYTPPPPWHEGMKCPFD